MRQPHSGAAECRRRWGVPSISSLMRTLVSKAGVVVIKRRAGPGRQTPQLVVMTAMAWRRISPSDGGAPAMPDVSPQTDTETAEANLPPMKRPTPAIVRETIGALRRAGTMVRPPVLVRALRDRTGCSRASAYRAIHDALAAGAIKCS